MPRLTHTSLSALALGSLLMTAACGRPEFEGTGTATGPSLPGTATPTVDASGNPIPAGTNPLTPTDTPPGGVGVVVPPPTGGGNEVVGVTEVPATPPPVITDPGGAPPAECSSFAVQRLIKVPDANTNPEALALTANLDQNQRLQYMFGNALCGPEHAASGPNGCFQVAAVGTLPRWDVIDGPRGVRRQNQGDSTAYPVAVARAATFDLDLEFRVGRQIGEQMVAFGQEMMLAPTINTLRHPAWGRAQETYGEDTVVLGEMGAAMIRGLQEFVPACLKHFAANNTEENRTTVFNSMDMQTLRENYVRNFEIAIEKGDPACIMGAYNGVQIDDQQGLHATEHPFLLRTILRDELGWNGFILTDWHASDASAAANTVNAGIDLDMPDSENFRNLPTDVAQGTVSLDRIEEATLRKVNIRSIWGQLQEDGPLNNGIVNDPAHVALPLEAAEKSAVLLKNAGLLPLQPGMRVLLAGPDGNVIESTTGNEAETKGRLGDNGSSEVDPPLQHLVTPLGGLQAFAASAGLGGVVDAQTDLAAAVAAAPTYDAVVLVVAMTHSDEGEGFGGGGDRDNLNLNGPHPVLWNDKPRAWIEQLAVANPNLVVVLNFASAVVEPSLQQANAVLFNFYPGQAGGTALANLLYGTVNFSGKLPFTMAANEADYPSFQNAAGVTAASYEYLHGYRKFDAEGLIPTYYFGHGLSYTTYAYSNLSAPCTGGISSTGLLVAQVDVTNTGTVAGTEVVQLYVGYPNTTVRRPVKELKAFTRVDLAPGETKRVQLSVPARDLRYWGPSGWTLETGVMHDVLVGPSANPAQLLAQPFMITP